MTQYFSSPRGGTIDVVTNSWMSQNGDGFQVFLEDAGFDWKILGPDVSEIDYVAWQCDQDAYACSGQKCSAQSLLFMHKNWAKAGACSPPWQNPFLPLAEAYLSFEKCKFQILHVMKRKSNRCCA